MSKKVILPLVAAVVILSGSAYVALNHNQTPIKVQNTASHIATNDTATQTQTPPTQIQDAQTTPVTATPVSTTSTDTPVQTSATPTPDQNKTQIMGVITDYAQAHGYTVYNQTSCFNESFTSGNEYGDYNTLSNDPLVQQYLAGQFMFDGPVTCRVVHLATN